MKLDETEVLPNNKIIKFFINCFIKVDDSMAK